MSFAQLPQNHDYQVVLRNYLETFDENDFKIDLKPLAYEANYFDSADKLYPAWIFRYDKGKRTATPEHEGLRVDASYFTLNSIEKNGKVNMSVGRKRFIDPVPTLWWARWDYPGNPYYDSQALKNRVFVSVAVDMMMVDQAHSEGRYERSDFLGTHLIWYGYVYQTVKDDLPADVQAAFEKGMRKMFQLVEKWGPTGIHADMDVFAVVGMWYIAKALDDSNLRQRAENYTRKKVFGSYPDGKGVYWPAGFIDHGGGFDPSYQGVSLAYTIWAALVSDSPFLKEKVDEMSKLKAYLSLPEPNSSEFFGPSNFATTTVDGSPNDQWGMYWRDLGAAMLSDEAKYLIWEGRSRFEYEIYTVPDESRMRSDIAGDFSNISSGTNNSEGLLEPSGKNPGTWDGSHPSPDRWTEISNSTSTYYKPGFYDEVRQLQQQNAPLTRAPFNRDKSFIKNFNDHFLSAKIGNYGAIIHTGDLSWWGDEKEIAGFGGGDLSAFWTPESGSILLGKKGGFTNDDKPDVWSNWRIWPTHAISGINDQNQPFSSARQKDPSSNYSVWGTDSARVEVTGDLSGSYPAPDNALRGKVTYDRVFNLKKSGLQITSSIQSKGKNKVKELFEILPVMVSDASIDLEVNGKWVKATTESQKTRRVRITRHNSPIYIKFNSNEQVKLSPSVWQTDYQRFNEPMRNIMVNLLNSEDGVTDLGNRKVRYTIKAQGSDFSTESVESVPPDLNVTHSPSTPNNTQKVTIEATANDDSGVDQIAIFAKGQRVKTCNSGNSCKATVGPYADGTYSYWATAADTEGNETKTSNHDVTVQTAKSEPDDEDREPEDEDEGSDEAPLPVTVEASLQQNQAALSAKVQEVSGQRVSGPQSESADLAYDWRVDEHSMAVVNMPLDVQLSGGQPEVKNYTSYQNNGHTGSASTAPAWTKNGRKAGAYVFDGSDDYVRVSPGLGSDSTKAPRRLQAVTVEGWVKPDGWGDPWAALVSKPFSAGSWGDPWAVVKLSRHSSSDKLNLQITAGNDEAFNIKSNKSVPSDTWTHVAGTYDGQTLKLYINGELDTSRQVGRPLADTPDTDIYLGKKSGGTDSPELFKGALDEVRVLRAALSARQIKKNYGLGYDQLTLDNTRAGQQWQVAISANDGERSSAPSLTNTVTTGESGDADSTPPELTVSHSPSDPNHTQKITITAEASDDSGVDQIALFAKGKKVKTCDNGDSCTATVGPYPDGTYSYYAKATDNAKSPNRSTTNEKKINVVIVNRPPSKVIPVLKKSNSYLEANVDDISDPEGDKVNLSYDWRIDGQSIALVNMSLDLEQKLDQKTTIKNYSSSAIKGKLVKSKLKSRDKTSLKWLKEGKRGRALKFSGYEYIRIPSSDQASLRQAFTIESWIKHKDWGDESATIVSRSISPKDKNNPQSLYRLGGHSSSNTLTFQMMAEGDEKVNIQSNTKIPKNEWVHIAATYNGNNMKLYINGELDTSMPVDKKLKVVTGNTVFNIGGQSDAKQSKANYMGALDELKILNIPLSANQIREHFKMNYGKIPLSDTKAGQNWSVVISANDSKDSAESVESNSVAITEKDLAANQESAETSLSQNYPNPFNSSTTIPFNINRSQKITIKIYDSAGRLVETIFEGVKEGFGNEVFDPSSFASGIYFYQLSTENKVITKKMIYIK